MTTPGVTTIPRTEPKAPSQPTVIAEGLPKTIYPASPSVPDLWNVEWRDTIATGSRLTIHGASTVQGGVIMTTAQVTVDL